MSFDFRQITGSEDSKQENFSSLCSRLVMRLCPDAKPVEGKGGDEGLDTFVGTFNNLCRAFQHKYFMDKIGPAQRKQIEASLKQAISCHQIVEWILMLPKDLNPSEIRWFDGLKKKYAPLQMDWWGKTRLQDLLAINPDIARDFQPQPNIVVMIAKEGTEIEELSNERMSDILKRAIGQPAGTSLPIDIVKAIKQQFIQRTRLTILVWGPGPSGTELYVKRCEIRDGLLRLGHVAHFSEDVWTPSVLAESGLNLSIAEFLQAKAYDYIICLMASPGSIGEVHDFARYPKLAHKMMVCVDNKHKSGYTALGILRIFEGYNGKIDWFQDPEDIKECHLATRVLEQINKVAEDKQLEIIYGVS